MSHTKDKTASILLTVIDLNVIFSRRESGCIVPPVQFRERGQTCCSHPVLEVFICLKIWRWVLVRVVWIPEYPVGGRNDLVEFSNITGRRTVLLSFARPGDTVLGKVIVRRASASRIRDWTEASERVCGLMSISWVNPR